MEKFALKSRENGDYLFNNYLLYVAAVKGENSAMAAHYKSEIATRFSDKMHRSFYAGNAALSFPAFLHIINGLASFAVLP